MLSFEDKAWLKTIVNLRDFLPQAKEYRNKNRKRWKLDNFLWNVCTTSSVQEAQLLQKDRVMRYQLIILSDAA